MTWWLSEPGYLVNRKRVRRNREFFFFIPIGDLFSYVSVAIFESGGRV